MSVNLRMFLVGHIALVPKFSVGDQGDLSIILPETRVHSHSYHHHVPVIIYQKGNLVDEQDYGFPGDELKCYINSDPAFGAVILEGQQVGVKDLQGGVLTFASGGKSELPDASDSKRFSWVAAIKDVAGGTGKILGTYYANAAADNVAGKLDIVGKYGTVETFGFADYMGYIYPFDFQGSPSSQVYAIADVVLVSLHSLQDQVELTFSALPDGQNGKPLAFKGDTGGFIDLVVANLSQCAPKSDAVKDGSHFGLFSGPLGMNVPVPLLKDTGSKKNKAEIEDPTKQPPILKFVEKCTPCEPPGLSNRPICALAVFEAP